MRTFQLPFRDSWEAGLRIGKSDKSFNSLSGILDVERSPIREHNLTFNSLSGILKVYTLSGDQWREAFNSLSGIQIHRGVDTGDFATFNSLSGILRDRGREFYIEFKTFQLPFRDSSTGRIWALSMSISFQLPFRDSLSLRRTLRLGIVTFNSLSGILA